MRDSANRLIGEALRHLPSARLVATDDSVGAYDMLYSAARKAMSAALAVKDSAQHVPAGTLRFSPADAFPDQVHADERWAPELARRLRTMVSEDETPAMASMKASGLAHRITRHGRVGSLAEAAAARGVEPRDIVKTLVVRRGEGDFLFVLVPGDREISWPKLRAHLGVNRLSMPDAATAKDVTGYERGTITPFGSTTAWPVVADATVPGRTVSIGAGAHGVAATAYGDDVVHVLGAEVADVTDPASPAPTVG